MIIGSVREGREGRSEGRGSDGRMGVVVVVVVLGMGVVVVVVVVVVLGIML